MLLVSMLMECGRMLSVLKFNRIIFHETICIYYLFSFNIVHFVFKNNLFRST